MRRVRRDGRAHIVQVVKGSLGETDVDLSNPSDQCIVSGQPAEYGDRDRLATAKRAVLYLAKDRSLLHLFVPGALGPLPEGSPLPFSTASPSPTASPPPG